MQISSASLEYVNATVAYKVNGAYTDPTGYPVAMAFPAPGTTPVTFYSASWDTDPTTSPPTYIAKCLVGSGGAVTLASGTYDVFVKVTGAVEQPVKNCGTLVVV